MKPRNYQNKAVEVTRLNKVNLFTMPQRSGKSFVFFMLVDKYKFKKVLIIVGYRKILKQLKTYFEDSTFILAGEEFNPEARVHIASFQTMNNRDIDLTQYSCIIQDEYHSRLSKKAKEVVFQEDCTVCLFTGTPLDNTNRRLTKGIDNFIQPTSVRELLENNWLAPTKFLMNSNMIESNKGELKTNRQDFDENTVRRIIQKEDLLQNIKNLILEENLLDNHHTVIYVNYIQTATELYEKLSELPNVNIIHSKMSQKEQDLALQRYENGSQGIIISVRSLSLGWDSPKTDRLIYGLFTKIHSLALQILWRASTINPEDPSKQAICYDMTGQLANINPYTDFSEYGKFKESCKNQCKVFPENSIERHICMESCNIPEDSFLICNGIPSHSFEEDPYKSEFVTKGKPCKQGHPFYQIEYKTTVPPDSIGKLWKWSKCPSCQFITRYTLTTITEPLKTIEMYQEDIPQNEVTVLYNRELRQALLIIDDLKLKQYKYQVVKSQEELYTYCLSIFKSRKFTITCNVNLPKLDNITVNKSLEPYIEVVDWDKEGKQSSIMKKIVTTRLAKLITSFGYKKGFLFYLNKTISSNEKEWTTLLDKNPDKFKVNKLKQKLEEK
jgi:hypothetical protein